MKKILVKIFICLVLLLPLLQEEFHLFKKGADLYGAFYIPVVEKLNPKNWFDTQFQSSLEKKVKYLIGFRPFLVRFYNQIDFSFNHHINANLIFKGKNGYFHGNTDSYFGKDYIGYSTIDEKMKKLKMIVDTLKKKQVHVIVVFTPDKTFFMPETIPEQFASQKRDTTNYEVFKKCAVKYSVPLVDFSSWFAEMKDTCAYPLYTKYGIHWSYYGAFYAMDSLKNYIGHLLNKPMVKIHNLGIRSTFIMEREDNDMEKLMNLMCKLPEQKVGYHDYYFVSDSNTYKPNLITVGDSYWFILNNLGFATDITNHYQYWFYFSTAYTKGSPQTKNIDEVNIQREIESADVVILSSTLGTLNRFAFGFIDKTYDIYYGNAKPSIK